MTDERRDDEIIGRALSRAIETIDVNQTPFERSRIATAPARRSIFGLWQIATAAAAIVLALAIGSWLTRPTEGQPGVAASPSASVATSTPAAPTASAVATTASDRIWVYFARDGLPPTGAFATGSFDDRRPESRILSRLSALRFARTGLPSGATNAFAEPTPTQSGTGTFGMSISLIQGDLATVEFELSSGWGVRGSAQSLALVQQLVYTITEEPGIRRALITEKGKPNAVIDQLVVDKPLSREDVFGYTAAPGDQIVSDGTRQVPATALRLSHAYSVDTFAPGLTRFVATVQSSSGALPDGYIPRFTAYLERVSAQGSSPNDIGKWRLSLVAEGTEANYGTEVVNGTPVRSIQTTAPLPNQTTYRIALDDARPWRAFTLTNPTRIVVDIGGDPRAVSDRIAVYRAQVFAATPACSTTCDLELSGAARVFEANVVWRVKDGAGKVIANGHFLTSLGTSAVWGTFDTSVQLPSGFTGNATLELYEASPKDGSEQGLVQIPLVIR
jgi:immunoglobulin-like protein involved in spore germination